MSPRREEAVVDGALFLELRDEDRDAVAALLAEVLLAELEAEDREAGDVGAEELAR